MSYDIVEEDASMQEKKVLINNPIGSKTKDFGERISVNGEPKGEFVAAKTPFTPKN